MKLCIPIASPDGLAAALHADFGAAQHLLVIDSESGTHIAVDRARPETIAEETIAGIQGIVCSEIHPRLLFELRHGVGARIGRGGHLAAAGFRFVSQQEEHQRGTGNRQQPNQEQVGEALMAQ